MTRDDIIRLAREAEINLLFKGHPEHPERDSNDEIIFTGWVHHSTLHRFAALVEAEAAARENEACAKVIDEIAARRDRKDWWVLRDAAFLIRNRGKA